MHSLAELKALAESMKQDLDKTTMALSGLAAAVVEANLYVELEAGCDGEGPVVEAYRALGEEVPADLQEYLDEDDGHGE